MIGNHQNGFIGQESRNTLFKNMLAHMRIYCGEGIIQNVNVGIAVDRSG